MSSEPKRILLIVDSLESGGLAKVLLMLAEALVGRKHVVGLVLLTDRVDYPLPEKVWFRSNPLRMPQQSWRHGTFRREVTRFAERMIALFEAESGRADLIVAAGELAIRCIPPIRHSRIVFSSHSSQLQAAKMPGRLGVWRLAFKRWRRGRRLQRLLNGRHVHVVSQGLADELINQLGVRPAGLYVIYNPFDIETIRAKATAATPESQARSRSFVIGIGALNKRKHFSRLVDAFAASGVDGDLVLVGQGEQEGMLLQLAQERGLTERLVIVPFHDNHYALLAKASLLVLTSDSEGLPNVLNEALIVGVPALSTDCPHGPRDILGPIDERALVPLDQAAELLPERIRSLIERPYVIPESMVDRVSVDRVIEQYLALIDCFDES